MEDRISEEKNRVDQYLQPSTLDRLMSTVEVNLIAKHQLLIVGEFEALLSEFRVPGMHTTLIFPFSMSQSILDLARMYSIITRVPSSIPQVQEKMETFVSSQGVASLSTVNDPRTFVETVMQIYHKYRFLVMDAFKGDARFEQTLDRACRRFINRPKGSDSEGAPIAPEYTARYADQILKKTGEKMEESKREETLDDLVISLL